MDNCDNFNCFSFLSEEEIALLEEKKTQVEFSPNELIFKQGGLSSHIFLVYSGYVKLQLEVSKFKRLNIYLAQKGDFLSLSSLFANDKYKYSTVAVTDVTLCMLEKNAVLEILNKNNKYLLFIVKRAIEIENRLVEVLQNISNKQMRGKLASALIYLRNNETFKENITQFITRQDLADFAGVTVENTVSLLKEFERDNIIKLNGRTIDIQNYELLKDIATKG